MALNIKEINERIKPLKEKRIPQKALKDILISLPISTGKKLNG